MSSWTPAQARRKSQRGSALLIVFVFAAIVAISLYMELPVAAFEAQRQKEQILVDRGHEYAHAVKLFVRKTGHYPTSIKDLSDKNRMRFLRHEYNDPFTGKNDWRLLHAGPNGVLIDSKVNPVANLTGQGGANGGAGGSGGGFGTPTSTATFPGGSNGSSGGGFGGSFGGSQPNAGSQPGFPGSSSTPGSGSPSTADSTPPEVMVQQPRQRGPAVAANGSQTENGADVNTASPPLPTDTLPGALPGVASGASGANGINGAGQLGATNGANAANGQPGNPPNGAGAAGSDGKSALLGGAGAPQQNGGGFGQSSASGQSSGFAQSSGFGSQLGVLNSGGIAGVASKAGGHTIKTVNDQSDYSLWEFYYDPSKDAVPGGIQAGAFAPQNGAAGTPNGAAGQSSGGFGQGSSFGQGSTAGQSSGFGQSGQSSGFGQSSFGGGSGGQSSGFGQSSFGQSSGTGNANQPPPASNNQQSPPPQ